jgi:hypothetical protein
MADWVMFNWSLSKAIENDSLVKFSPRWIPVPDLPMKVVMDLPPDTERMLEKDPLLMQMSCRRGCRHRRCGTYGRSQSSALYRGRLPRGDGWRKDALGLCEER